MATKLRKHEKYKTNLSELFHTVLVIMSLSPCTDEKYTHK